MNKLIYYIEDDQDDADLFFAASESVNATTIHFGSCKKFLDFLEQAKKPDLIFLDSALPGCNRDETIAIIKSHNVSMGVPIIIYSGGVLPDDVRRLTQIEKVFYDRKPNNFKDILGIICKHLDKL